MGWWSWGRAWFGATALAVLVGVVISIPVAAVNSSGHFESPLARALNVFAFFTVQSNLIVGVTCLLLALNPRRGSAVFHTFRLIGLVAITITGLVYHVALAHLLDVDSWALAADVLLHTVVPVMAVAGWLLYGPRGATSPRIVALTLVFPAAYMLFTVVRGAFVGWYPYPFADVGALGYGRVLVNAFWIALLFVAVAAGAHALDRRLPAGGASSLAEG
jgi:hypothetical protein